MKQIIDYKKRFEVLLESSIGDVRPLVSEQMVQLKRTKERDITKTLNFGNSFSNRVKVTYKNNPKLLQQQEAKITELLNEKNIGKINGLTQQKDLWSEILKNDRPLAADVVTFVNNPTNNWVKNITFSKYKGETETGGSEVPPTQEDSLAKQTEYSLATGENAVTKGYYEDNKWILSDAGKKDIESTFIQPFLQIKQQIEQDGVSVVNGGCISFISVATSASRFRNSGQAEKYSFKQLSEARANSLYTYVFERLKSVGFTQWCSGSERKSINSNGGNGDGTTGPNPPKGFNFVGKDATNMTQVVTDETKRGEFGEPHKGREEYDKYKYNNLNIGVSFLVTSKQPENTPPEQTEPAKLDPAFLKYTEYNVVFTGVIKSKWKFKFRPPKLNFSTPYKPIFKTGVADCPIWNK